MTEPTEKDPTAELPEIAERDPLSAQELEELEKALLSDPLREVTRRKRTFLLGASLIAFVSVKAGLVPTKIAAFGIECSQMDSNWFLFILGIVVLYFWVAFLVYAISDGTLWWTIVRLLKQNADLLKRRTEKDAQRMVWMKKDAVYQFTAKYLPFFPRYHITGLYPIAYSRVFFDFLFPLLIALFVMFSVYRKLPSSFWGQIF